MEVPPNRWMVYVMENPIQKWMMIWGYPYDSGNPHVGLPKAEQNLKRLQPLSRCWRGAREISLG